MVLENRTLNDWIADIHALAVEKGWWDGERDDDAVIALIHSEWSEALEEYRNGQPMVYCRMYDELECGGCLEHRGDCVCNVEKPEGIAVELIDGVIRILDYFGASNVAQKGTMDELGNGCCIKIIGEWPLTRTIRELHMLTVTGQYATAVGVVVSWLKAQGIDAEEFMRIKHNYNKTRPYRHGGKTC